MGQRISGSSAASIGAQAEGCQAMTSSRYCDTSCISQSCFVLAKAMLRAHGKLLTVILGNQSWQPKICTFSNSSGGPEGCGSLLGTHSQCSGENEEKSIRASVAGSLMTLIRARRT